MPKHQINRDFGSRFLDGLSDPLFAIHSSDKLTGNIPQASDPAPKARQSIEATIYPGDVKLNRDSMVASEDASGDALGSHDLHKFQFRQELFLVMSQHGKNRS